MSVALVIASVALVVITAVYAWHTRAMVAEMRSTRELAVTPRLALDFNMLGPLHATARITNIGAGSALRVRAKITAAAIGDQREWSRPLMRPGDSAEFLLKAQGDAPNTALDLNRAAEFGVVVRLEAEALDVYGVRHTSDEEIDLKAWWASVVTSEQSYTETAEAVTNRELKKIGSELENMRRRFPSELAAGLARALQVEHPGTE